MEQTNLNWLEEESKLLESTKLKERLPALKLEENKITEINVDFSAPFDKWQDPESGAVKKIIPCTHEGRKKVFWLNTANPCYIELIVAGKAGQTKFKILRTGQAAGTRYSIIKE